MMYNQNMDLSVLQKEIRTWHARNYPKQSVMGNVLAVAEEVGEVARAYVKQESEVRGTWDHWQAEKAKELGDVLIGVLIVIEREGFDVESVLLQRWETIKNRDYLENPDTGGRESE
jgi:NTP pyrophosphatase (non-canonical NTP hydrolase)